ncbi:Mut7-C RNAse domain-containing protein [bacterium]|nr:Mut7-C RNAse domain-containing protein [bacterium]
MTRQEQIRPQSDGSETSSGSSFLADDQLGKLARWLRILGFDTLYFREIEDRQLIRKAADDNRILLTRDTRIASHSGPANCIFVESDNWIDQLKQVIAQLKLKLTPDNLFSRCLLCNSALEPIPKADVKERVPPFVFQTQEEFVHCPSCDKIYWQGTHVSHVLDVLKPLL